MVKTISVIGFLALAAAFNANAHDANRIAQLEKEIQDIKSRLSRIETFPGNQPRALEPAAASDGWKVVTNWRKLNKDMSEIDVRRILGEPDRIDGGNLATWRYQNGGRIVFFEGRVDHWNEPRK